RPGAPGPLLDPRAQRRGQSRGGETVSLDVKEPVAGSAPQPQLALPAGDPSVVPLYGFMPYGAPELLEIGRKYLTRALTTSMIGFAVAYLLLLGVSFWLSHRPHESS